MKFRKGASEAVGLDIGSSWVKGVKVLSAAGGTLQLVQSALIPIPPGSGRPEKIEAIRQAVQILSPRAARIITAVGGTGAVVRPVVLPKMTPQEIRAALTYEADKYIPFKTEETYFDFAVLGNRPDGRTEILLAAARRELIQAHLDLLNEAGVTPTAVDLEMLALNNVWELNHPHGEFGVTAVIHMGARATLIVFFQGLQFAFGREISIGGESFTQALSQNLRLNASAAEQLKKEPGQRLNEVQATLASRWEEWLKQAQVSFDFFEDQFSRRVDRLVLSGGGSQLTGFKDWVEKTSEIPTEMWNPLAGISGGESAGSGVVLAVALGLAAREVVPHQIPSGGARQGDGGG